MSYYPVDEGEVEMYKRLEKKVLADKATEEAKVMDMKYALGISSLEGAPILSLWHVA